MINVLLYIALVLEILSVITTLTEARKPREGMTPAGTFLSGVFILIYLVPLVWLLATGPTPLVAGLAAFVLAALAASTAVLVRQIFGIRGPRTPASVFGWTLANFACTGALVALLVVT